MRADGGGVRRQAPYLFSTVSTWSPDGSRVAFYSQDDRVVTTAPDGTDLRGVVASSFLYLAAWNPARPARSVDVEACAEGGVVPDPEANPGLVEDCRVLLGLRDELAGSAGLNWNETLPIGRWEGVFLEGSPPRVYSVAPAGVRLTGRLPADLGKLTALRSLDLEDRLTGPIPPELGNLKQLEFLNLEGNYLSGPIPPELGGLANVERLDVADNLLTGSIPPELGSLTKLEVLDLSVNFLSGPIPPELSALEKLDSFHGQWNELSESIPPELAGLKEVTRLDLQWNELRGPIPPELGDLKNLEVLDLTGNPLTGCVPREISIEQLYVGGLQPCSRPEDARP